MESKKYIKIPADSWDDLIAKYHQALNRIMDLEIGLFEIQEEISEKTNE